MPAGGPGGAVYIPGKGTITRKPSGKAKSFQGSGEAPAGTVKEPEATYKTAPTVTVHSDGSVTTSGFSKRQAAEAARAKQKRSEARTKRIVAFVNSGPQKPAESLKAPEAPKAPKLPSVPVVAHKRSEPGPTTKKTVPVAGHSRGLPKNDYSVPVSQDPRILAAERRDAKGFAKEQRELGKRDLKGTPKERKAARAKVQRTKKVLAASRGSDGSVEGEVGSTLLNHGFNRRGASGVIGNAKQESSLQTTANDGYGNGGLFGFTAEPVSLRNLQEYAASKGQDWTNPRVQTRFMLANLDPSVKQAVNHASSPEEAAYLFQEGFEKPGKPMQANRERYAAEAFSSSAFSKANPQAKANYKAAVKEAKELNLKVSPLGKPNVGKAPPKVVKKYKQALTTMKNIDSQHFSYSWGGGHRSFSGPYDCSGAVSAMLHSVGALKAPLVSGAMGEALEPGPGAITIFYNGAHTFAYIPALKKYWGTSTSNPGGGAGFFPKSVGDAEVASGNSAGAYKVGHVPGLGKKQALQLGAGLGSLTAASGSSQPFPGMTLSPSGTSATINQGKGKKQAKVGFSNQPLTVAQVEEKLGALSSPDSPAASTSVLSELERKYGAAA